MLRRSLVIAGVALSTLIAVGDPSGAQSTNGRHVTVAHHVYTYKPQSGLHCYAQ
jgi:hypothetical protein